MKNNINIYCITHKIVPLIEELGLIPFGAGINQYPLSYLKDNSGINIANKNENYGDLTFHYWYWKNHKLKDSNRLIGICDYRRFFIQPKFENNIKNNLISINDLKKIIIKNTLDEWCNYDVILRKPIDLTNIKFAKLIKKNFMALIFNPGIIFFKKYRTIKLQFDTFHERGLLSLATNLLNDSDKKDFEKYCNTRTQLAANSSFICREKILYNFYPILFDWLFKCEDQFKNKRLEGYGLKRIYTFLAERFIPFWFEKYYKTTTCPWVFYDSTILKKISL
jgi:hypothetical protein